MTPTTSTLTVTRDFLLAGDARFTVASPKNGHYTYLVQATRFGDAVEPKYFVKLLTGPDNLTDYTYLGMLTADLRVVRTAKSRVTVDALSWKVLVWALDVVAGRVTLGSSGLPAGYSIRHDGTCGRCGRTLTEPLSLTLGIGPECRGKMADGVDAPRLTRQAKRRKLLVEVHGSQPKPTVQVVPATSTGGDYDGTLDYNEAAAARPWEFVR